MPPSMPASMPSFPTVSGPQRVIASPIGPILLEGDGTQLTAIRIGGNAAPNAVGDAVLNAAADQLAEYFLGNRTQFDLPLAPAPSSRGQALRDAMCAIPYGATLSYGALAHSAGSGPRAIGQACARNRFPIVVPCHRVTGANGTLGHYSAGDGITTKRWLLAHENEDERQGDLWAG